MHVGDGTLGIALGDMRTQTKSTVFRKEARFGRGDDSLYRIGFNKDLIGSVASAASAGSDSIHVQLQGEALLADTRLSGKYLPVWISGYVTHGEIDRSVELAVAVNGRIQALTRAFRTTGIQRFRAMVPESALREGRNRVDVFAIEFHGGKRRLVRIGGTASRVGD